MFVASRKRPNFEFWILVAQTTEGSSYSLASERLKKLKSITMAVKEMPAKMIITCLTKLLLGVTMGLAFLTLDKAVSRFSSFSFIRKEMVTEADLLMPILQWINTLPALFFASLMNVYVEVKYFS